MEVPAVDEVNATEDEQLCHGWKETRGEQCHTWYHVLKSYNPLIIPVSVMWNTRYFLR